MSMWAQETPQADSLGVMVPDSLQLEVDSLQLGLDTLVNDSVNPRQILLDSLKASSDLQAVVDYKATDSIVFDMEEGMLYLYSGADIKYDKMGLQASMVKVDWENELIYAEGVPDSTGELQGKPMFVEDGQEYNAERMIYNFKTQKGRIMAGRTMQGNDYLLSDTTKRMPDGTLFAKGAKFTTCDLDHPHFYIQSNKIKVLPNNQIISGPLRLIIEDFPIPIVVPFGFIPDMKGGRRSGIKLPEYGYANERGFFLRNLGYYLGLSDNWDMLVEGDIYTIGGWRAALQAKYNKKYKYQGALGLSYGVVRFGESDDPDFSRTNEWRLNWSHSQPLDPTFRFSSSVNITSSNRYNRQVSYNTQDFFQNNLNSSISLQKRFNNLPFSLSLNINHRQDLNKETVSMTLPTLAINMNRLTPFRNLSSKKSMEWLTRLGLNYSAQASNRLETIPDSIFVPVLFNWGDSTDVLLSDSTIMRRRNSSFYRNGMEHRASASTTIKLLKYINVNPSFSYNEYWYTQTIKRRYNEETDEVEEENIPGFSAARDYSMSVSASTNFYGIYSLINSPREITFRQRFSPSISYSYRPDFSDARFGYYDVVQVDSTGRTERYNRFQNGIFGSPSAFESQSIGFSLSSVLEMKYKKKEALDPDFDEDKDPYERITLLDNLGISTSYNFVADSFQLAPFRLSARTRLLNGKINLNTSASIDPYALNAEGTRRMNEFVWRESGKLSLGRITNAQVSLSTSFRSQSNKKKAKSDDFDEDEFRQIQYDIEEYVDFDVPWDLRLSYNLSYSKPLNTSRVTQTLRTSGNVNFTSKWKIGFSSGYDFQRQEVTNTSFTVYRDLHCWSMNFSWTPFGPLQAYVLNIQVNSATLRDLKLTKRNQWQDRRRF